MDSCEEKKIQIIHKEIDLIQSVINRMAKNSFLIKGWLISLVVVILALKPNEVNINLSVIILGIVTIAFWYLDAFFLKTEKIYREMYEFVIEEREKGVFNNLYNLNPSKLPSSIKKKYPNILEVMMSKTLCWFYLILLIALLLMYISY